MYIFQFTKNYRKCDNLSVPHSNIDLMIGFEVGNVQIVNKCTCTLTSFAADKGKSEMV